MAPKPAEMPGAMPHEAAIWDTLFDFQAQATCKLAPIPTPMSPPTIDWVVETGNPMAVQAVCQMEDP